VTGDLQAAGDTQATPRCSRCGTLVPHPDPRDGTCQPCTNREVLEPLAHLSELLADIDACLSDLETTVGDTEVHTP